MASGISIPSFVQHYWVSGWAIQTSSSATIVRTAGLALAARRESTNFIPFQPSIACAGFYKAIDWQRESGAVNFGNQREQNLAV
jgi:hypothetical protein